MSIKTTKITFPSLLCERKNFPPWIIHWFMLGDDTRIYLDRTFLVNLIKKGILKAGSERALSAELSRLGEPFDQAKIYRLKKGEYKGLAIRKVKALLSFLGMSYNTIDSLFQAIGGRQSIKNVKFPINLNCRAGGRLIAATLSDGGIYLRDPRQKKFAFHYFNTDEELVDRVINSVQEAIGDAHHYYDGHRLSFSSRLISDILIQAGVTPGRKTSANLHLPPVIHHGKPETIKGYFCHVFADESSMWEGGIEYKRTINLSSFLENKHLNELDGLGWKEKIMPREGGILKYIGYTKKLERMISKELKDIIWTHPPKLLIEERDKLKETYGIEATTRPRGINKTKRGYTVVWALQIFGERNIKIFANKIGFGCEIKQRKLEDMLRRRSVKLS